jgi:chemotaxis regulatin CheY-phosphate phosphatase CheZ
MTSKTRLSGELLDDSAATLRLVDSLLDELREGEEIVIEEGKRVHRVIQELAIRPTGLAQLPNVLLRAYSEIVGALETLRQSRGVLERATVERVHRTHQKLQEVSSATELAATDMLDGLDRALALIDRMESDQPGEGEQARGELRDELFRLIGCLQFQDITAQQLRFASNVLEEIEGRLAAIADLFDMSLSGVEGEAGEGGSQAGGTTFDPAASMLNAENRQAVADLIFTTPAKP